MRIVQVSPYSWDAPGGVQIHIRQLSHQLRQRGHDVLVLAPGDVPGMREDALIVGRTFTMWANGSVAKVCLSPRALRRVRRAFDDFAPDVIHVHEPFAPGISVQAVLSATAPVVGTFHSYFAHDTFEGFIYAAVTPLLRSIWRRVDARIAVSQAARFSAASRLGPGKFQILPNGAEVDHFASAKAATNVPQGRRLLFVGRLEPRKGLPFAIRAFEQLAPDYPDLSLIVVGDGPERHAVDALSPALRERVHMMGTVTYDALPTYHKAADIFISPATGAESFGIVLVEAMAAGLPVVASDIPGYREVARHGKEGLLVKPSDAAALAAGIRTLLDDPAQAARLGENGFERSRVFAWDSIIDQLETVYESLAKLPRKEPVLVAV